MQVLIKWPLNVRIEDQVLQDFLSEEAPVINHFEEMNRKGHTERVKGSKLSFKINDMFIVSIVDLPGDEKPTDAEVKQIVDELTGQMSDGIFENFGSGRCPCWDEGCGFFQSKHREYDEEEYEEEPIEFIKWFVEPVVEF